MAFCSLLMGQATCENLLIYCFQIAVALSELQAWRIQECKMIFIVIRSSLLG